MCLTDRLTPGTGRREATSFLLMYKARHAHKRLYTSGGSRIFPRGGGANSQNCYYFSHFCRKLHENERIWTPRGGVRPWRPPLDPPMYTVLPKYSKIQVLPGITSYRLMKYNKQAIELNSLLINNMPKDGYG